MRTVLANGEKSFLLRAARFKGSNLGLAASLLDPSSGVIGSGKMASAKKMGAPIPGTSIEREFFDFEVINLRRKAGAHRHFEEMD